MVYLPQAAVSRVCHQDMACDFCGRVPFAARLVDPEEADAPDEMRLGFRSDIPV